MAKRERENLPHDELLDVCSKREMTASHSGSRCHKNPVAALPCIEALDREAVDFKAVSAASVSAIGNYPTHKCGSACPD